MSVLNLICDFVGLLIMDYQLSIYSYCISSVECIIHIMRKDSRIYCC